MKPIQRPEDKAGSRHSSPFQYSRRAALALGAGGVLGVLAVDRATAETRQPDPRVSFPAYQPPADPLTANVRDHGALGDGVTDDIAAFRSAMAALAEAGGGTFLIPPGTYLLNDVIFLTDNVRITSPGATLTKTAGSRSYFVSLSGANKGFGSGVKNVLAEGLTFQGDFSIDSHAGGFSLHHAEDVIVQNCKFVETQGTGHCFDLGGCRRITVQDCDFIGFNSFRGAQYNRSEAIQMDQSSLNSVSYRDDPASYDGLFTRDVRVINNRFLPLEAHGKVYPCPNPVGAHVSRENHFFENLEFRDNLIVDPIEDPSTPENDEENRGATFKGVTHLPAFRDLVIANNTYRLSSPRSVRAISVYTTNYGTLDYDYDKPTSPVGAFTPIPSEDVTITGNTFSGFMPSSGAIEQEVIFIRGVADGPSLRVRINGNSFEDTRAADGRGDVAIRVEHCEQLQVNENRIAESAGGVALHGVRQFTVNDNRITAGPGDPPPYGILITDDSNRGVVADNVINGFSQAVDTSGAGPDVNVRSA